jgi:heparin binding hemagglutinin HbhA
MSATKTDNKHEYPSAVYAAAGFGDIAYRQLRKLPEYADRLRAEAEKLRERAPEFRSQATEKADGLRHQATGQFNAFRADAVGETGKLKAKAAEFGATATDKAAELTSKVDIEKVRATLVSGAQNVAEKAIKLYEDLVARGEKVVEPHDAAAPTGAPAAPAEAEDKADIADVMKTVSEAAETAQAEEAWEAKAKDEPKAEKPRLIKPTAPRKPKSNGTK